MQTNINSTILSKNSVVEQIYQEVSRRRNFAIISHPDAGKTTLTEKLLLYGGAIQEAGAVKAKRTQRSATSDWNVFNFLHDAKSSFLIVK